MNQENIRPISTYDNLSARSAAATATATAAAAAASSNINTNSNTNTNTNSNSISNASQPKVQQLGSNTSATQPSGTIDNGISGYQNATAETHQQQHNPSSSDLNETRANNSIAAVRAALSDAKCKFFGINNYEYDALHPSAAAVSLSPSSDATNSSGCQAQGTKATSNYANVIDASPISVSVLPEASGLQPMKTTPATSSTFTPDRVLPYGTTYEQIPLSDLDIPQPSQAVYMSTTVPQNIKGMKIAGRHTPTRNSLRHSRMIVVNNKTRHSIHESYSSHIRNLNLSRQLLIFQLAIGLLIVCLSVWILILAPNASILINPYLSGLSLLLASIAGLILLGRNRRSEYQRSYHNCYKVLLVESYVFCTLALIFCSLALVCAAIEFAEVNSSLASGDAACGPATSSLLNYRNCTCLTEIPTTESEAEAESEITTDNTGSQSTNESDSLNCQAIGGEWKYILGCSMALNTAGIVATFLYIMIYICCYRSSRKHFNTSI